MLLSARALVLLVPTALVAAACGSSRAPSPTGANASLTFAPALLAAPPMGATGDPAVPPRAHPGPVLPPPPATTGTVQPPPPPACTNQCTELPQCTFGYSYEDSSDPLQKQLGCSPVYRYTNGANSGILGGVGSFCPDTAANRKILHDKGRKGYAHGYCDTCLNVPCGKLFVFWSFMIGPGCPSGCRIGTAPPDI